MCDVATGTLITTMILGTYGAVSTKAAADKQQEIERNKLATQEKVIKEATPTVVENVKTNQDKAKETLRLRRGISQSIYSTSAGTNVKKMGD